MKKNERWSQDYRRHRSIKYDRDDLDKGNDQLKSLECSSVQQVQPTNQSYQMSWLQKLVNNMDDNKLNNANIDHVNRNFSRKNSTSNHTHTNYNSHDLELRNKNGYSINRNQNLHEKYTPTRIPDKNYRDSQEYSRPVNNHRNNQNQRMITKNYINDNSAQKYTSYHERKSSIKYNNYAGTSDNKQRQRNRDTHNTHNIHNRDQFKDRQPDYKQVDLNQSTQSYGKIKKINKYKEQVDNVNNSTGKYKAKTDMVLQNRQKFKSYSSVQKKQNDRFATQANLRKTIYENQNLVNQSSGASSVANYLRESRNRVNMITNMTSNIPKYQYPKQQSVKTKAFDYNPSNTTSHNVPSVSPKYEKTGYKYKNQGQLTSTTPGKYDRSEKQTQKNIPTQKSRQLEKGSVSKEKQQDFKMQEMAKKLNMVLQNINKKSKMISSNNNYPEQMTNNDKKNFTPIRQLSNLAQNSQSKNVYPFQGSSPFHHQQLKSNKKQPKQLYNQKPKQYLQKPRDMYMQRPKQDVKEMSKYYSKQKVKQNEREYMRQMPRQHLRQQLRSALREPIKQPTPMPYKQKQYSHSIAPTSYANKNQTKPAYQYNTYSSLNEPQNYLQPQKASQTKYQLMKKSLSMYKHIPKQIILQQSSSQINSQISPRMQILNRELKTIFQALDKNKIGELSKNNFDVQQVNDEVKYLFGGIFSKIKYKGEVIGLKAFLQQCQHIVKELKIEELRQVLNNKKGTTTFKINQKDTQSQRWNNDTNNDIDSKRSSERSEVVKKYEFVQQKQKQMEKQIDKLIKINQSNAKNRQKVNWNSQQNPRFNPSTLKLQNENQSTKYKIIKKQQSLELPKKQINKHITPFNSQYSHTSSLKESNKYSDTQKPQKTQQTNNPTEKQNIKTVGEGSSKAPNQKQKKDFEKMCENLNSKLNNYLTTIKQKQITIPHIPLQFSELSKHWSVSK